MNLDSDHSPRVMTWSVSQYFNLIMRFLVRLRNDYVIISIQ